MTVFNYIVACVHLYGMIHEDRIIRIYNKHHPDHQIKSLGKQNIDALENEYVHYEHCFYIHQAIYYNNDMAEHLEMTNEKPYLLLSQEELMNYLDNEYYERKPSMDTLYDYIIKHLESDPNIVQGLLDDIVLLASDEANIKVLMFEFTRRGIQFSEYQIHDIVRLLTAVLNDSRMWVNNGFTPKELANYDKRYQNAKRNDPCPCQSGKKFKHCCMRIGYINDDLGVLTYDNIFLTIDKEKHLFENKILFEIEIINHDCLELENPSYKDFVADYMGMYYDDHNNIDPKIISGALLKSLLLSHDIKNIEKEFENIMRQLKIWSKRTTVLKLHKEIEEVLFGNDNLSYESNFFAKIIDALDGLGYKEDNIYINKDNYKGLLDLLKKETYDAEKTTFLTDLTFEVYESKVKQKHAVLHHFIQITPFLPQTISMLLSQDLNLESKINLLNAYIDAYQTVNKEDFSNPIDKFTRYKDHKEYILALDSLAYIYKNEGEYDKAIFIYEKMMTYDDEDRFGAKEGSLICYIQSSQFDKFDDTYKLLNNDSLYKIFLDLFFNMARGQSFVEEYEKAYEKSSIVLDMICQTTDVDETKLAIYEKEFLEDFFDSFVTEEKYKSLVQMHIDHQSLLS